MPFILPIVILVIWYIITSGLHLVKLYILPSPIDVCYSAIHSLSSGSLIENTINTLIKVFSGLILASVIAIHLGILIGRNQTLEELTSFVISILRLFPPVAWIPFSILWFGIGSVPAVFIIFISSSLAFKFLGFSLMLSFF